MRKTTLKLYLKSHRLQPALRGLLRNEKGQDLIEYVLLMMLMAGAAAAGVGSVAVKINQAFTVIATKLTSYTS